MLKIDSHRLQNDIEALADIGLKKGRGVFRMGFTEADFKARKWLKTKIQEAELDLYEDGAANIWGRLNEDDSKPSVIMGSHIDTVPGGGPLDGALGVLAALECLRRIREEKIETTYPLEMVSFTDEEGRFGGLFGSQAVCGQLTQEGIYNSRDLNGVSIVSEMAKYGMTADNAFKAKREVQSIRAYLELHIEQGPVLDSKKIPVGLVENISGLLHWDITFIGQANHAGTTPMHMRLDAFQGLVELANQIPEILKTEGTEKSVATIGKAELYPGAMNVVPGVAKFTLDVRDPDPERLKKLGKAFRNALSQVARNRGLAFELDVTSEIQPARCDKAMVRAIEETIKEFGLPVYRLSSGSVHDALIMSSIAPMGMIFVPSINGRSHSPDERTDWEDIESGANVALNSLLKIAEAKI